jgi:hypothetical protein
MNICVSHPQAAVRNSLSHQLLFVGAMKPNLMTARQTKSQSTDFLKDYPDPFGLTPP